MHLKKKLQKPVEKCKALFFLTMIFYWRVSVGSPWGYIQICIKCWFCRNIEQCTVCRWTIVLCIIEIIRLCTELIQENTNSMLQTSLPQILFPKRQMKITLRSNTQTALTYIWDNASVFCHSIYLHSHMQHERVVIPLFSDQSVVWFSSDGCHTDFPFQANFIKEEIPFRRHNYFCAAKLFLCFANKKNRSVIVSQFSSSSTH